MDLELICTHCGQRALRRAPTHRDPNLWHGILWACFLIPGLLYTMWRILSNSRCPRCGEPTLIQRPTPLGDVAATNDPDRAHDQGVDVSIRAPGLVSLVIGSVTLVALAWYMSWPKSSTPAKAPILIDAQTINCAETPANPLCKPKR